MSVNCTYPVTPASSPACIVSAFKASGYYNLLSPTQQAELNNNPAGWLEAHPYLYETYPAFFASSTSSSASSLFTVPSSSNLLNMPNLSNLENNVSSASSSNYAASGYSSYNQPSNPFISAGKDLYGAIASFGNWLSSGLPNLIQSPANALATVITAAGEHPLGGLFVMALLVLLIIFFIIH